MKQQEPGRPMEKTALCPGTYDPLTEGHRDVIIRCSKVFKRVVVAISKNTRKKPLYSIEKRMDFAGKVFGDIKNIEIVSFEGLLIDMAETSDAQALDYDLSINCFCHIYKKSLKRYDLYIFNIAKYPGRKTHPFFKTV